MWKEADSFPAVKLRPRIMASSTENSRGAGRTTIQTMRTASPTAAAAAIEAAAAHWRAPTLAFLSGAISEVEEEL